MKLTEDRRTILIWGIGIIILLVLCLTLLLLTGCVTNIVTDPVEEPVIEEDTEATVTVYPQKWATGDGTFENPWANDCIKKALDFAPTGGTIYLRAGYYQLAGAVTVEKAINIIGEGMGKTFIVTADNFGFNVDVNYATFKGFTVDGAAQTENAETSYCMAIANRDYVVLEDIEVKNCGRIGINILNVNYSLFQNIYAHDNYEHGLHPGGSSAGRHQYNTFNNIYSWDNGSSGFDDWSSVVAGNNTYNNLNCWDNGEHGIAIVNQIGIALSNSSASRNGTNGIYLYDIKESTVDNCFVTESGTQGMLLATVEDTSFNNCSVTLNDGTGVFLKENCSNVNLTNGIVKNNLNGITIYNGSDIALTTCQSYDDRETPLQEYGLTLYETNTGISLLNCKLSPNKDGEIYNPNGVAVTVITEKMLAKF